MAYDGIFGLRDIEGGLVERYSVTSAGRITAKNSASMAYGHTVGSDGALRCRLPPSIDKFDVRLDSFCGRLMITQLLQQPQSDIDFSISRQSWPFD